MRGWLLRPRWRSGRPDDRRSRALRSRAAASNIHWASIFFVAIVLLFGAAGEEMLFHGYAFQLPDALDRSLCRPFSPRAVLFGFGHIANQGANLLGIVNTVFWGVLLGYAYIRTGALWMPIGHPLSDGIWCCRCSDRI